ncbi:hypothetical protein MKX01_040890, partial [Papaver californicum]
VRSRHNAATAAANDDIVKPSDTKFISGHADVKAGVLAVKGKRYFDSYGIIRDTMQNHLLQILALFAMETPVSLDAEHIRNEKVKVIRLMKPLQLGNVVVGQYKSQTKWGVNYPGYTDDGTIPKNSITPTFAAAVLFIDNARWDGVPFLMEAGKALHTRRAEIRVQFRHVPGNLYKKNFGMDLDRATDELVIRVQPDEAIYLKINNKVPGLGMKLDRSNLNLHYAARYSKEIPDAYERLLLDAIEGERRLGRPRHNIIAFS